MSNLNVNLRINWSWMSTTSTRQVQVFSGAPKNRLLLRESQLSRLFVVCFCNLVSSECSNSTTVRFIRPTNRTFNDDANVPTGLDLIVQFGRSSTRKGLE